MTVAIAIKRNHVRHIRLKSRRALISEKAWLSVKGIWKGRGMDPVRYQKRVRKEADQKHV